MKRMTNMDKNINKKIDQKLTERGYYSLVSEFRDWDNRMESYPKIIAIIVCMLGSIYNVYNYPRTFEYILSHPISEIIYLVRTPLIVACIISLIVTVLIAIIYYSLLVKIRRMHKQVYREFGIEEPELEI